MLSKYDLLVVLGADPVRMSVWSEVEPLPEDMPVVHIGLVDWDMGKNFAAEMAVRADVRETLLALTPVLKKQGGERLAARAQGVAGASSRRATGPPSARSLRERIESRAQRQADRSATGSPCRSPMPCRATPWSSTRA